MRRRRSVVLWVAIAYAAGAGLIVGMGYLWQVPDRSGQGTAGIVPASTSLAVAARPYPVGDLTHGLDGRPLVALSFDDGPSLEDTPRILKVLAEKNVKATFFLQGSRVQEHPEIAREVVAAGHQIGGHSYDHPWFPNLTAQQTEEEIVGTNKFIEDATGIKVSLFRYPFGQSSAAGDAVLAREGLSSVLWHWDSNLQGDYECPGSAGVQRFLLTEATGQAIFLLHDAGDVTRCPPDQLDYLPRAIDALRAKGFEFGVVIAADQPSAINKGSRVKVVLPSGQNE